MKRTRLGVLGLVLALSSCSSNDEDKTVPASVPTSALEFELDPNQAAKFTIPGRNNLTMHIVRRGESLAAYVSEPFEDAPKYPRRRIEFAAASNEEGRIESYHFHHEPSEKLNLGLESPSSGIVFADVDGDGLPDYRSDASGVYRATGIQWERIHSGGVVPDEPVVVKQSILEPVAR